MDNVTSQEQFNKQVAENLVKYRKHNNLTQLALAEKLNYSDKSVSKWESGECLPDIFVLNSIAKIYGITVNDLISPSAKIKAPTNTANRFFVPTLSCCIVWLVALIAFFVLKAVFPSATKLWMCFIFAIPITAIVELVFACIYKMQFMQIFSISCIIWTTVLSLHLALNDIMSQIILLYLVAIPLQILFILWYIYLGIIKKRKKL